MTRIHLTIIILTITRLWLRLRLGLWSRITTCLWSRLVIPGLNGSWSRSWSGSRCRSRSCLRISRLNRWRCTITRHSWTTTVSWISRCLVTITSSVRSRLFIVSRLCSRVLTITRTTSGCWLTIPRCRLLPTIPGSRLTTLLTITTRSHSTITIINRSRTVLRITLLH
ncbi:hypothetical protein HanRHA438_Chr04g0160251 [Helianthus annuus]|nr:hypothetical protein HanRHA438_Chr04g0160251 [Helianthus annuus]